MSFDTIPAELLEAIFRHIDAWSDLVALKMVCRRWTAAVETFLIPRSCLKVAHRVPWCKGEQTRMIEKNLLMNSSRRYTCLRVECADDWKERGNREDFEKLLDVCQERYLVRKLRLRITPDEALAGLFVERRDWLENLTELFVEVGSVFYEQPRQDTDIEVSLPVLKRLTWLHVDNTEYDFRIKFCENRYIEPCYSFVLNIPNLERLKVGMNRKIDRNRLKILLRGDPNVCCLFQPRLKLRSYGKIQHVEIEGPLEVRPQFICVPLLQNLKSLSFVNCYGTAIQEICDRCTHLEELFIDLPPAFHISPTVSPLLKKLTLRGTGNSFETEGEVEFPQLRYLRLVDVTGSLNSNSLTLLVPQLTTLIVSRFDYDMLNMPYKEHIRTMAIELDCSQISNYASPPPNVTELFLRQKFEDPTEAQHYLQYFPNLRRLTVYGIGGTFDGTILNCAVVRRNLPLLEYFHAHELTLRLADLHHLKHLKSLILSHCTISTTPIAVGKVLLKDLDYFRVKRVTLEGTGWECFPICGNERQPPVEIEEQLPNGWRTFSSLNFQLKRWAPSNPI